MARLTRAARYRLPPGEFHNGDLVIRIDPPKDEVYNIDTPIDPAPSQHTDDDRFGRHRQHLLKECGHEKLKFEGFDDFMELPDGQEPVRDVYGWYEVSEWPGAKQRLKDTEKFLAYLKGQDYRPPSESSPDPFDDSDQDETFEPEDDETLLPSEAQTIEEDIDGAVYLPSPEKLRRPGYGNASPRLGAFTPVQVRQRRFTKPKFVKNKTNEAAERRKAYNENITRGLGPAPRSKPEPRRDSATQVLAKLNAALQVDIDNGLVSPHSKRNYSRKERDGRRRSSTMTANIDPALLEEDDNSNTQPRSRTQRTSYRTKKRKSRAESVDDDEAVLTMPKKKRRSTRLSQVPIYGAGQDDTELDPTQPKANEKVYPPLRDPNAKLSLWPQYEEAAALLPDGYQVRVRFVSNADHILPKYMKEQRKEIDLLLNDLEKSLVYYLLTLPNWRATAMQEGLDELKSQARNYILTKLKEIEKIWLKIFNDINVHFTLPTANDLNGCPRITAPMRQRTKANSGNNHTPGLPSITKAPRRKQSRRTQPTNSIPPALLNGHLSLATFTTEFSVLRIRQLTALLETARFQTSTPKTLWQRQSTAGTRQRRLYESNMRVAALAWQVGFFEGWGREIGRLRARQVQKMVQEGRGDMRYWKQEVVGGRAGEWEVVDLMTGVREPLKQWEKKHGMRGDGDSERDGAEDERDKDEEEEGAIARSIRKAKETSTHNRPGGRARTSHDRLQAAVGYSPPDKNLEEHNRLQDELRRRQQQEQLRLNRCSRVGGVQGDIQPDSVQGPSLYEAGAITDVHNQPFTHQEQWEFAQGLGQDGQVINPRTGAYSRPGYYPQSYRQTGPGAGAGGMPLDPTLQAFDVQRQQYFHHMQQQQRMQIHQEQYAAIQQQQMRAQYQLPTPMTPTTGHAQQAAISMYASNFEQMPTHAEIFTTPHGTAGVRLISSPGHSFDPYQHLGSQDTLRLRGGNGEENEMFYSPSPALAGPSSPLRFAREYGHDEIEHEHEPGNEHKNRHGRERDYESNHVLSHDVLQYLPDGTTLANLREYYESVGRFADANAIRALEAATATASITAGSGVENVPPMGVDGNFGANNLGETGETEEEAAARGEGDGFEGWKMMLVGES